MDASTVMAYEAEGNGNKKARLSGGHRRGISLRAYARHRKELGLPGGSLSAVQKAVESGRIECLPDGSIDPERADLAWESGTSPRAAAGPGGDSAYLRSRAMREAYEARLKKLAYEERAGSLVDAQAVEKEAFKKAQMIRDSLLSIPARLESILAAESDPVRVRAILDDELRSLLSGLADAKP